MALAVARREGPQPGCLDRCYRFFRSAEAATGLGAYLDKYQRVLLAGDDIDFTLRAAVVRLDDVIAVVPEELARQLFAHFPGIALFHRSCSAISLTGVNERRCSGQG